jgi:hypothetical protein
LHRLDCYVIAGGANEVREKVTEKAVDNLAANRISPSSGTGSPPSARSTSAPSTAPQLGAKAVLQTK